MTVSIQLYSMRDHGDQIALLDKLSAIGITNIEGYGGVYGDPKAYRKAMDANGISMPSGHMALNDIEDNFDTTLNIATTLGIVCIFAPYLEEQDRPDNTTGYTKLAHRLNAAAKRYAEHGISFGWHNHDFEFVTLADGGVPMDILLEEAPDITWEADLAWIVRGKSDPFDYIQRYGNRLRAIHVKDIAKDGTHLDEDGWSDLGAGVLDWTALLQACRTQSLGLIYALEHDKPSDPVGYATRSAAAFQNLWENTHD